MGIGRLQCRQLYRRGQREHERHLRETLPPDPVEETIEYSIIEEDIGRLGLQPTGEFDVFQHTESPDSPVFVTEYRLAAGSFFQLLHESIQAHIENRPTPSQLPS